MADLILIHKFGTRVRAAAAVREAGALPRYCGASSVPAVSTEVDAGHFVDVTLQQFFGGCFTRPAQESAVHCRAEVHSAP